MIVHLNYDLSRLNPFVNLVQSSAKTKDLFKIHEALNKVVFNQTVLVPQRLVILKQKAAGTQTQRKKNVEMAMNITIRWYFSFHCDIKEIKFLKASNQVPLVPESQGQSANQVCDGHNPEFIVN